MLKSTGKARHVSHLSRQHRRAQPLGENAAMTRLPSA